MGKKPYKINTLNNKDLKNNNTKIINKYLVKNTSIFTQCIYIDRELEECMVIINSEEGREEESREEIGLRIGFIFPTFNYIIFLQSLLSWKYASLSLPLDVVLSVYACLSHVL